MCTQGNNEIIKTLKKELEEVKLRLGELEEYTHGTEIAKVDSEEIELEEMDINNILRALDYFKEHNSICNVWTTGRLIEKLNKMLKEKDETAKA